MVTFVIGLGNIAIINFKGEWSVNMEDILLIVLDVFVRLNCSDLHPAITFVH